jgi:hypothetical protein
VVPFRAVDEVWHTHILQSVERYRTDVRSALGFVLDHVAGLPDDPQSGASVLMDELLSEIYVPMAVHNSEHAGCDGHACCEADF